MDILEQLDLVKTLLESPQQLDELSKDTLRSYTSKASETLAGRGRKSAKKIKRQSSVELAKQKLHQILHKEFEAGEKKREKHAAGIQTHFLKEAPKVLANHGYSKLHSANGSDVYHKGHDNGHSSLVRISAPRSKYEGTNFTIHSTNGSGTGMGHNHQIDHSDSHHNNVTKMMNSFEHTIIGHHDDHKRLHMYESVEQINEDEYIKRQIEFVKRDSKDKGYTPQRRKAAREKLKSLRKLLTKEQVELEEARRGRPPKDAAKKAAFDAASTDEPKMHIIAQLNKAKTSSIPTPIHFKDGSKHEVHPVHAEKILARYSGLKPQEKLEFQKRVAQSHASLKNELI